MSAGVAAGRANLITAAETVYLLAHGCVARASSAAAPATRALPPHPFRP
jgi:hypothetical protein